MSDSTETGLRAYLRANMFDGDEGGSTTVKSGHLLDEVTELVALWMVEQCGALDCMEEYFGSPGGRDGDQ